MLRITETQEKKKQKEEQKYEENGYD